MEEGRGECCEDGGGKGNRRGSAKEGRRVREGGREVGREGELIGKTDMMGGVRIG